MSFVIPLSRNGGSPLTRQIYNWFRQAILQRTMRSGERLPSTRELAEQLHVSRTVAVLAYEQLLAEGFVARVRERMCRRDWQRLTGAPRQSSRK
jgi:GntR family transcriptional regulator / MocR family aminotransferase